jgi:endonuclease III-like uncharacterized protein
MAPAAASRRPVRSARAAAGAQPVFLPPPLAPRPHPLRRRLLRLHERLVRRYGPPVRRPARDRAAILVGALLSASPGTWRGLEDAADRVRACRSRDLERLLARAPDRLAALAGPAGAVRTARARLRALARQLRHRHGGRLARLLRAPLPVLRAELRAIPGVRAETADAIALHAAGRPVFVADVTTRRLLARQGIVPPGAAAAAVQRLVMRHLPHDPKLFGELHALLSRAARDAGRPAPPRRAREPGAPGGRAARGGARGRPPAAPRRGKGPGGAR